MWVLNAQSTKLSKEEDDASDDKTPEPAGVKPLNQKVGTDT